LQTAAASITAKIASRDAFGGMRSLAPLISTSIIGGDHKEPEEVGCTDGCCMTTGANDVASSVKAAARSRAFLRHVKIWLAETRCRRAISVMIAPS